MLVVSSKHFQSNSVVAGNGTDRVHNVDWVRGKQGNWQRPTGCLDEVVQFGKVFRKVKDGREFFVHKLANLRFKLLVRTKEAKIDLFNKLQVFEFIVKQLFKYQVARVFVWVLITNLDLYGFEELVRFRIQLQQFSL